MARATDDMLPESDAQQGAPHPRANVDFIGQADAERELLQAYQSGKLPHAWIIGGDKGIGKATLAWRFAKFVLAHPDFSSPAVQSAKTLAVEDSNAAVQRIHALGHGDVQILRREWNEKTKKHFSEIRSEDVRKAVHMFQQTASEGGYRIVILDCAEDLNSTSANALLKMIEEPPERSLFLIISHQPNRILPTIRSRCRMLLLQPLSQTECKVALQGFVAGVDEQHLDRACQLALGSVSRALKLISGKSLDVSTKLESILRNLPRVDWREVHALADGLTARANEEEYETFKDTVMDWLHGQIHRAQPLAALAPFADSWDAVSGLIRQSEAYNLDRRALVLSVISTLAKAADMARGHQTPNQA